MAARIVRALGALVLMAALLTACGLGDKESYADAIVDGTEATFDAGTAIGTLSISMRTLEFPAGLGSIGGVQLGGDLAEAQQEALKQESQAVVADVAMDLAGDRASLTIPGTAGPFALYDGMEAYGRRYDASERDARPWVRIDLADLDEGGSELSPTEDVPFIGGYAISPVALLDLLAGPLTGSIERVGEEDIDGVATTRYDANFDIDKVLRDTRRSRWPEDRREALEELLDVLSVRGTTHDGQVWLDADGRPRRFKLRLQEEPVRKLRLEIIIQLDLLDIGGGVTVEVPTPQERIDVGNVVQFLRSMIPSPTDTAAFEAFLGIDVPDELVAPIASDGATTTTTAPPATDTTVPAP